MTKIYCKYDELVKLSDLKPNPDNPNVHTDEQIDLLSKIISKNGWRERITVSNRSGMIVKGHGRFMAAEKAGLSEAPVEYQDYDSAAAEAADLVADNKIAELSFIDNEAARKVIEGLEDFEIGKGLDLSDFGFTENEAFEIFGTGTGQGDGTGHNKYTRNIEAPIYTPKGEKPKPSELFDDTKTNELITEIESSKIPNEIKNFMIHAARRHTVFNYGLIAEYYAHASKKVQVLMENSGLVIIDFKRAIELGYVKLSEEIAKQYGLDYPDA